MNKRCLVLLTIAWVSVFLAPNVQGQWALNFRSALGYGLFREQGVSPVTFQGATIVPALDLCYQLPDWRLSWENDVDVGGYEDAVPPQFNFTTLSVGYRLRIKALCRMVEAPLPLWAGLSLDNHLIFNLNPNLNNAQWGLSDFVMLNLHGRVEKALECTGRRSGCVRQWRVYAEMALSPAALVFRPGYAYLDNYNSDGSGGFLKSYRLGFKGPVPAVETELGITRMLHNGNTIGIAYRWNFLTSGDASASRFEQASHLLILNFHFQL